MNRSTRLVLPAIAAIILAMAACSTDAGSSPGTGSARDQQQPSSEATPTTDPAATRSDIACRPTNLGDDEQTETVVAHWVVDGRLGARCFGHDDPTLLDAWASLAAFTPPDDLKDLTVFAGFIDPRSSVSEDEDITSAFTDDLGDDGTAYLMSVNLDDYDDSGDAAVMVMAHELSHVFTTTPDQLDRSGAAVDACTTYLSPVDDGCFRTGSLIAEWVREFWGRGRLDQVDPEVDPTTGSGEELCSIDPSFLGPYAASDPEEDFAETFSAFVFDVEVRDPEVQDKLDWMADQPELVPFRTRAEDAGLTPRPNGFDRCG